MASLTPISQTHFLFNKPHLKLSSPRTETCFQSSFVSKRLCFQLKAPVFGKMPLKNTAVVAATTAEKPKKRYPGEAKGFVEEMRFVAMKLHTREQAKEGEKEVKEKEEEAVRKWEPSIDGYLKFLVDSKLVYDTLEEIVEKASFPFYAEFRNTGLERSEKLAKDLEWFKEQGYTIPKPSSPGVTYSQILQELSEKDPQAFICHFYNIYFAHSAGGQMIGRKVRGVVQLASVLVVCRSCKMMSKCVGVEMWISEFYFKTHQHANQRPSRSFLLSHDTADTTTAITAFTSFNQVIITTEENTETIEG